MLLKNDLSPRKSLLHIWNQSWLENFDILVTFHHSLDRKERFNNFLTKTKHFWGCFAC